MFDVDSEKNTSENSLCLSFFVSGELYHSYIPFLLYGLSKAYPEYFTIIAVKNILSSSIKRQIDS